MDHQYTEQITDALSTQGFEFLTQWSPIVTLCTPPHIHTAVELLYFVRGEHKVITGNQEILISPGHAIMFRINELHHIYSLTPRALYRGVKFSPSFVMELAGNESGASHLLAFSLRKGEAIIIDPDTCEQSGLPELMLKLEHEKGNPDRFTSLSMKISVSQIVVMLLRILSNPHSLSDKVYKDVTFAQRIYEIIAYIEQNYANDITAQDCADHAHVSYSYFSRLFKEFTGKSFKQYLNDVRFDHAEKELLSTNNSITEILTSCGFNNAAYFSAQYKKRTGLTPTEARKILLLPANG